MNDVEELLLALWRARKDEEAVKKTCEQLIAVAPKQLNKVELYLPQFAHMIIVLADDVAAVVAVERFVLSVCQVSIHLVSAPPSVLLQCVPVRCGACGVWSCSRPSLACTERVSRGCA